MPCLCAVRRSPVAANNRGILATSVKKPPNLKAKMRPCCHQRTLNVQRSWRRRSMVSISYSSELPFRQIFCHASQCRRLFFICSHCYRNHRYCSPDCRELSSIEQRRAARRRHRQSPEGRDDGRDRQRAYRRRKADLARAEAQKTVMDHTPNPPLSSGIIASPPVAAPIKAPWRPFLSTFGRIVCHFCGRVGRFLNPFIESG